MYFKLEIDHVKNEHMNERKNKEKGRETKKGAGRKEETKISLKLVH